MNDFIYISQKCYLESNIETSTEILSNFNEILQKSILNSVHMKTIISIVESHAIVIDKLKSNRDYAITYVSLNLIVELYKLFKDDGIVLMYDMPQLDNVSDELKQTLANSIIIISELYNCNDDSKIKTFECGDING